MILYQRLLSKRYPKRPLSFPLYTLKLDRSVTKDSKPRLDLLLRILQRPLAPRRPTPHLIHLRPREPLRLHRGIVPDPRPARHVAIRHGLVRPPVRPLVDRHDRGAPEAEVVLQRRRRVPDEPVVGPAAQLPDELRALREAGRAERVAFGYEPAGGVDDAAAPVRDVPRAHHLVRFAGFAEAQGVQGDHLVRREAVVQLADPHVFRVDARFGAGGACGKLRHAEPHQVDGRAVEEIGSVGGEVLACYLYRLRTKVWASVEEIFGDDDGGGAAVGRGAALEFCEG